MLGEGDVAAFNEAVDLLAGTQTGMTLIGPGLDEEEQPRGVGSGHEVGGSAERLSQLPQLSPDVYELVNKSLK
jgi:hypothetical protein